MNKFKRCIRSVVFVAIFTFASLTLPGLMSSGSAQTAVTGGLSGVVADSTGAIVPKRYGHDSEYHYRGHSRANDECRGTLCRFVSEAWQILHLGDRAQHAVEYHIRTDPGRSAIGRQPYGHSSRQ